MQGDWAEPNALWCIVVAISAAALGIVCFFASRRERIFAVSVFIALQFSLGIAAFWSGQPLLIVAPPLTLAGAGALCWAAVVLAPIVRRRLSFVAVSGRWAWLGLTVVGPLAGLWWMQHAESGAVARSIHKLMQAASDQIDPSGPKARMDDDRPVYLSPGIVTVLDDRQQKSLEASFLRRWDVAGRLIRLAPADPNCNCHGWVFAGGRYPLSGNDVESILQGNAYRPVTEPRVGDLVVYRDSFGAVMHSGVVHSIVADSATPLVESMWMNMGRYLHPADIYQFHGAKSTFFRSAREGHVLQGLDQPVLPDVKTAQAKPSVPLN